eukprot:402951-Amphidinium_carterae.3
MCESTIGLRYETVVPYKGINAEALKGVKAITRFIVENGLQTTILQSDGEPAILELLMELARQLPTRQSQGIVERYHQTLFAQLRTIKFQFSQQCNIDPRNISSHNPLINHLLHHTMWLLNRYLRHSDGKTSYVRNGKHWKQPYKQPIIALAEKVYVDKLMPDNRKLYRRNQDQKHEAIWIGRDTTTGQHITLTEEFGKVITRTVLRLPREQQIDRDLLLKVTTLTGEHNPKKKTDKDTTPIPQLFELRSPTQPTLRQQPGTTQQKWHYRPPDQRSLEIQQRVPKFPTFPKPTEKTSATDTTGTTSTSAANSTTTTCQEMNNNQTHTFKGRLVGND